ncbi:MAG: histidinol-phosphate transaminase [Fimbriimonadales bacterium]
MPVRLPEQLSQLRPYVPGIPIEEVQQEFGISEIVKLASNENPLGPSPLALQAIVDFARYGSLYPDAGCVELKSLLASHVGLPTSQISVSNGSDEMIHLLSLLLLRPGDNIVMGDPGFSRYESEALAAGAQTRKVSLDENARHDVSAMLAAIDNNTRIVWLANPNNPTGTILRRSEVGALIENVPEHTLTVLDEAYFEFATDSEYPSSVDYIRSGKQVVGLRTFSKTYGLAGLRVGYAMGPERMIDAVERVRAPFNVNALAQRAAIAALSDTKHLTAAVDINKAGNERLHRFLSERGYRVFESYANFVWYDMGFPTQDFCRQLLMRGVIVRPGSVFGYDNHIRVSIGTDAELDAFETAFDAILQESVRA